MWSDRETDIDFLGYSSYVEVLSNVALHPELAPLTLGIFGSWGSGKSSLMRMLRKSIDDKNAEKTVTIWFNAWRYEGKEEAQSALIHAIIHAIESRQGLVEEAKNLIKQVVSGASVIKVSKFIAKTAITMTPDFKGFADLFSDESKKLADTMESFDSKFGELLKAAKIDRIIVFIDDLDRCSSSKVIETFETIKLFLNTPACTFVIGADAKRIEAAVGDIYSIPMADDRSRRDYLEKIIQVPFNIPQQSSEDIGAYVAMLLICRAPTPEIIASVVAERAKLVESANLLSDCQTWLEANRALLGEEHDPVKADIAATVPYIPILARGLKGNPRQIKRFLNILAVRRQLATTNKLEVKSELLIKLAVLEYVWETLFRAISDTVDPKSGASELLASMLNEEQRDDLQKQSPLLAGALQDTDAMQFVLAEPPLAADLDLRPYMFLAQTSLSRQPTTELLPTSAETKQLVSAIESEDRIVSKSAAQRAAGGEKGLAESVVASLCQRFGGIQSETARTHVVMGLGILASGHPDLYGRLVEFLSTTTSVPSAAGLFVPDILAKAKENGVAVPAELEGKFTNAIAKAMKGKK